MRSILAGALALVGVLLSAHAQAQRSATIEFTAPTHYTDGTPINVALSYRVYQGTCGSAPSEKQLIGEITETQTVVNSGLESGGEYGWHVVAVAGGEQSAPSNEACKAFRVPQTVTITVT